MVQGHSFLEDDLLLQIYEQSSRPAKILTIFVALQKNRYLCSMKAVVVVLLVILGLWLHKVTRDNGRPR